MKRPSVDLDVNQIMENIAKDMILNATTDWPSFDDVIVDGDNVLLTLNGYLMSTMTWKRFLLAGAGA